MSKAYQDKVTGKWKWGTRGEAIHDSKSECEKAGISSLVNTLRRIRERISKTVNSHGK